MNKRSGILGDIDYKLFVIVAILCAFGLTVLNSASQSLKTGPGIMRSQKIATILGFIVLVVLTLIDYRNWKILYKLIYLASVAILVYTLLFGFGPAGTNIKSWVKIGFSFQPSEFVKVAFIICFGAYLEEVGDELNNPVTLVRVLAFGFLPIALILLQPDMGTALVYIFIMVMMLFIAGIHWKYIAIAVGVFLISLPIIWLSLKDYQKNRIFDFLNPYENPTGSTYQYIQGEIAIGSGQFLGKGLYQGTQNQFNFIPAKENDFIFPVLVEELGFVGGFSLLVLYLLMIFRMSKISRRSVDKFGAYMTIGIAALFLFHIWENIGMTLGVMPITGIPLPFFSQGGSFQLTNLAMVGLVLSVAAHRHIKYF